MTDLIDRQAAIEVLRSRWLKTRNYEGIGEDIAEECEIYLKTLPSAQPEADAVARDMATIIENEKDMRVIQKNAEQQWIPVTERLPEPYITVLVTYKSGVVSFAWYNGRYWTRGAMSKQKMLKTVKAWMSLPAPYEGE